MTLPILCVDLDGTFINCENRYYSVYRDIILKMAGVPLPQKLFWALKREKAPDDELLRMSRIVGLESANYRSQAIEQIEQIDYLNLDDLFPAVLPALEEARSYFNKIVLITLRRNSNTLHNQLDRLDITRHLDHILSGSNDNVTAWQMKADLFQSLGIAMDRDRAGDYFIGDTEVDILAGKQIGLKTIAVTSGIRSKKILEKYGPDCIFRNFVDFIHSLRRFAAE